MKNNDLQKEQAHLFNFGCAPIRARIDTIGMPWFNANDVCEALQLGNSRQAIESHVDSEDVQKLDTLTTGQSAQKYNEWLDLPTTPQRQLGTDPLRRAKT